MTVPLFKVTGPAGEPIHGGSGLWPLPTQGSDGKWIPGEWRAVEGSVIACRNGLHLTWAEGIGVWLRAGPSHRHVDRVVWLAEGRGEAVGQRADGKVAYPEARLLRPVVTVSPLILGGIDQEASLAEVIRYVRTEGAADLARREAERVEAERINREYQAMLQRTSAKHAAQAGLPVIFGQHTVAPDEAWCPAWPTAAEWERRLRDRTDRRIRRVLGWTPAMERLVKSGNAAIIKAATAGRGRLAVAP